MKLAKETNTNKNTCQVIYPLPPPSKNRLCDRTYKTRKRTIDVHIPRSLPFANTYVNVFSSCQLISRVCFLSLKRNHAISDNDIVVFDRGLNHCNRRRCRRPRGVHQQRRWPSRQRRHVWYVYYKSFVV